MTVDVKNIHLKNKKAQIHKCRIFLIYFNVGKNCFTKVLSLSACVTKMAMHLLLAYIFFCRSMYCLRFSAVSVNWTLGGLTSELDFARLDALPFSVSIL